MPSRDPPRQAAPRMGSAWAMQAVASQDPRVRALVHRRATRTETAVVAARGYGRGGWKARDGPPPLCRVAYPDWERPLTAAREGLGPEAGVEVATERLLADVARPGRRSACRASPRDQVAPLSNWRDCSSQQLRPVRDGGTCSFNRTNRSASAADTVDGATAAFVQTFVKNGRAILDHTTLSDILANETGRGPGRH
ncbi:hypothetical protein CHELA1G11_11804 [Hyphomicrobiales bacterium]|nr:hypothetical protein CHELA1G11_11804 [Hyphomicrobiales bacterium]CAH1665308.1 hypothetical protein CHELA1G2_12503 [Hyphomicrobiales bacterium]